MAVGKKQVRHSLWRELGAVMLFGLSLLLLLALVSFDPGDVAHFRNPPNNPVVNFIGPIGAYVAAVLFFIFGIGSYLTPLAICGVGTLLLTRPGFNVPLKITLGFVWLASAAALLQLLDSSALIGSWNPLQQPTSSTHLIGGWLGYTLHNKLLSLWLGNLGSALVMGLLCSIVSFFFFEVHPVHLARMGWQQWVAWQQEQERKKLEEASPSEKLAYQKKLLEKQQKVLQKELAKKGVVVPLEKPLPALNRPIPQVFDTTLPAMTKPKESSAQEMDASASTKIADRQLTAKSAKTKKSESIPAPDYDNYQLPGLNLLQENKSEGRVVVSEFELRAHQLQLINTLAQFGVEVSPGDITRGATITRYEIFPAPGVRVERIVSLQKDIARAMKAERINILAPIPGKDTVGIEVANSSKSKIVLHDLLQTPEWLNHKAHLPVAIGKDIYGKVIIDDLAEMPHALIAGTTGSGKSVCINCLLLSLLYRFTPDELRIILVDPKVVELQVYNTLPHLVVPVVTDPKKVLLALRWVINEMEKRYKIMAKAGVRNIVAYNQRNRSKPKELPLQFEVSDEQEDDLREEIDMPEKLPYIVVIIDELADLMQTTPADVESAIARLSAKARAAGIHLVIATQTPRASVITGVIKTNVPARIAFQVPSALDSRVILDENGAENLLGKGDLLYLRPGSSKLLRAQGAFVSEDEVGRVVQFISRQSKPSYEVEIHEKLNRSTGEEEEEISQKDEDLIEKCMEVVRQEKRASTSLLQRRLKIGYGRAAWVMDQLESRGIVGPKDGAKDREIMVDLDALENGT